LQRLDKFILEPRNGSWTGVPYRDSVFVGDMSVHFSDFLARPHLANMDRAGLILQGGITRLGSLNNVQSHL